MPDDGLDTRGSIRVQALREGHLQWGCQGRHHGTGAPDCPRHLHHHHDAFCAKPTPMELQIAGVTEPEGGWLARA